MPLLFLKGEIQNMTDFLAACLGLFSRTCVALASLSIFNFFLCVLLFLVAIGLASYLLAAGGGKRV